MAHWADLFLKLPSSHFCTGTCQTTCTSWRSLCWTACLDCVSALWASPYKGVPGIYFNQDWGFSHSVKPVQLWPIWAALLWPIRIVPFGPNCEDLEAPGKGSRVHISQLPSGLESAISLSTKGCSWLSWNTKVRGCTARLYHNWAILHRMKFTSSWHPTLRIPVASNWHQWLSVDKGWYFF